MVTELLWLLTINCKKGNKKHHPCFKTSKVIAMQNKFSFRLAAILFAAIMLTSCSKKDQADTIAAPGNGQASKMAPGVDKTGTITGWINPVIEKTTITVYNQANTFGPFYPGWSDGKFRIADIPAGFYKMSIRYPSISFDPGGQTDYSTIVHEVAVEAGIITDMGEIRLQ